MNDEQRRESDRAQWRRIDALADELGKMAAANAAVAVELRHIRKYMEQTDKRLDAIDRDVRKLDAARNRLMGLVAGVGLASGASGAGFMAAILRVLD